MIKTTSFFKPLFYLFLLCSIVSLSSYTYNNDNANGGGLFIYQVNGKIFKMENVKAYLRNTTGGRKQLSLSNDRFVKFFFINPTSKNFDLSTPAAKEAIIRYNEPGTNNVYSPKAGHVNIMNMNDTAKFISGDFEMEMAMPGSDKVIKITQGQIVNVPVVFVK